MQLIEVEGVDALLSPHQDVLVPGVGVDPTCCTVDFQRATIEHFREAGSHVNLGRRRKTIGCGFRWWRCSLLRWSSVSTTWWSMWWWASILSSVRPRLMCSAVRKWSVSRAGRPRYVENFQSSLCRLWALITNVDINNYVNQNNFTITSEPEDLRLARGGGAGELFWLFWLVLSDILKVDWSWYLWPLTPALTLAPLSWLPSPWPLQ